MRKAYIENVSDEALMTITTLTLKELSRIARLWNGPRVLIPRTGEVVRIYYEEGDDILRIKGEEVRENGES